MFPFIHNLEEDDMCVYIDFPLFWYYPLEYTPLDIDENVLKSLVLFTI